MYKRLIILVFICITVQNAYSQDCSKHELRTIAQHFCDTTFLGESPFEHLEDTTREVAGEILATDYFNCLKGKKKRQLRKLLGEPNKIFDSCSCLDTGTSSWTYYLSGWNQDRSFNLINGSELIIGFDKRNRIICMNVRSY